MKEKIPVRKYFGRKIRFVLEKIIPETSSLYKIIYFNAIKLQSIKRNKRKKNLVFQVNITEGCNLDCLGCNAYAPLREKKFLDINSFEKDISRIAELTDGIVEKITYQGGEPLIHPNIVSFFEVTRKYIKSGELGIITNGILLQKQEPFFWESCKKNEVKIYISPYPIKLDKERISEMSKKYSVDTRFVTEGSRIFFRKRPLNIDGNYDIVKNFRKCIVSDCWTLFEGKFFACQTAAYIGWFNEHFGQKFETTEKDYIDIHSAKSKDEILDFLCKPLPFCRYCNIDATIFGIPWGLTKKEISEWL